MIEQSSRFSASQVVAPGIDGSRVGVNPGAVAALGACVSDSDFEKAVRFARLQREGMSRWRVLPQLTGDRPAPPRRADRPWFLLMLALGSVAAHGAVLTPFESKAAPLPSVGLEAISVEMVVGADTTSGGVAAVPDQSPQNVSPPPMPDEGQDAVRTRLAAVNTKTAEAVQPDQSAELRDALPAETEVLLEKPAAEVLPTMPPTLRPRPVSKPDLATSRIKPDTKIREASLHAAPESDADRRSRQVVAGNVSGGVGIGRSDATPEYRGIVAAHLARYKQFPNDARRVGAQGNATVSFALDGEGRVVSVELTNGAGYPSLDEEARAMVHRASPFPAPTGGQGVNFTVPVAFNLR